MAGFKRGSQAVFSRNWFQYLRDAAARARRDSAKITVFQSKVRWVSAKEVVDRRPVRIYFAVNREDDDYSETPCVEYVAELVEVRVDPGARDRDWLRRNALPTTKSEGLWGKTLYAIANCKAVRPGFPITELRKVRQDDSRLDRHYRRSYALVRERTS